MIIHGSLEIDSSFLCNLLRRRLGRFGVMARMHSTLFLSQQANSHCRKLAHSHPRAEYN
jgi:hypothetical protein